MNSSNFIRVQKKVTKDKVNRESLLGEVVGGAWDSKMEPEATLPECQ